MNQTPQTNPLFKFLDQHFAEKSPYDILGINKNATLREAGGAFLRKMTELAPQTGETAEYARALLIESRKMIFDASHRQGLNQWIKSRSEEARQVVSSAKVYMLPVANALRDAADKIPFSKAAVTVGASMVALGSVALAVKATETISHKKDEGEHPTQADRAAQALGYAGAASAVSAALLMWKHSTPQKG